MVCLKCLGMVDSSMMPELGNLVDIRLLKITIFFDNQNQYNSNRLSSTKGGNREMDQLCTTSQVSNITRKTKFSHINLLDYKNLE